MKMGKLNFIILSKMSKVFELSETPILDWVNNHHPTISNVTGG